MSTSSWSQSLQTRTRECIDEASVSPLDGRLHFKNLDGRYAAMSLDNLLSGNLSLADKADGEVSTFHSVDALIEAGWAVD